jgi:hypothetical protein
MRKRKAGQADEREKFREKESEAGGPECSDTPASLGKLPFSSIWKVLKEVFGANDPPVQRAGD